MALIRRDNQYKGVNAHLHSYFQGKTNLDPSLYPSFHTQHIVHITDALNAQLPDHYIAHSETSLQIRAETPTSPYPIERSPKPDITIYNRPQSSRYMVNDYVATATLEAPPTLAMDIPAPPLEADELHAIVIYHTAERDEHSVTGNPIVHLELLSPANKVGGRGAETYQEKRRLAIESGLILIELDYLHESHSPIHGLPRYPLDANCFAYHIALTNPHVRPPQKAVLIYGFGVDYPIPAIRIPLVGAESIVFDFNAVYHHTFLTGRWGNIAVDYAQEPARLDTYHPTDQESIRAVMQRLQQPTPTPDAS